MQKEKLPVKELYRKADEVLALLDLEAPVPEGLAARIMNRKGTIQLPRVSRLNISTLVQVAAALLFGVFIGHQFGKLVKDQPPKLKQDSATLYFKAHHLNLRSDAARANPLYF